MAIDINVETKLAEELKEHAIKSSISKQPSQALEQCLVCYTKDQLMDIANEHGVRLRKSWLKAKMIEHVEETLIQNIARDFFYLTSVEREVLIDIILGKKIEEPFIGKTEVLRRIGYLFLFYYKEDFHLVVPEELKTQIKEIHEKGYEDTLERNESIRKYITALLEIYGVYEIQQLIEIWNQHNEHKLDKAEVEEYLASTGPRQGRYWWDAPYVVSSCFKNQKEYKSFLKSRADSQYYIPTPEEIQVYKTNALHEESIHYKGLHNYFKKNSPVSQGKINEIMHSMVMSCVLDEPIKKVFKVLDNYGHAFRNADDINHFVRLYTVLDHDTRKWTLKGYQPKELQEEETSSKPQASSQTNSPGLLVRAPKRKTKVGRNAPCPCGSGKKYKFCCLK